jgi:hypothetical protein
MAVSAGLFVSWPFADGSRRFGAMLVAGMPFLPPVTALITLAWFFAIPAKCGLCSLVIGVSVAIDLWLIAAYILRFYAGAQYANRSSYDRVRHQFTSMGYEVEPDCEPDVLRDDDGKGQEEVRPAPSTDKADKLSSQTNAEIELHVAKTKEEIGAGGLQWVLASGYTLIWQRLHRVEEAQFIITSVPEVLAAAQYDFDRLTNSKIDQRATLQLEIQTAIKALQPSGIDLPASRGSLRPSAVGPTSRPASTGNQISVSDPQAQKTPATQTVIESSRHTTQFAAGSPPPAAVGVGAAAAKHKEAVVEPSPQPQGPDAGDVAPAASPEKQESSSASEVTTNNTVRTTLQNVSRTINEYRDERFNSFIVARNRLWMTMFLSGMLTFILLSTAILRHATRQAVGVAVIYFLVGALAGVINRLRDDSEVDTAVEDYGLSTARLFSVPLISGLAGLAGVLLAQGQLQSALLNVSAIFSTGVSIANLTVAATAGLTPSVIFNRLRQQTEKSKETLKLSEAAS